MAVFSSETEMYEHFAPFLAELVEDPAVGPKFVAANTSFRVHYSAPDSVMLLDATQNPAVNLFGDEARSAPAELELFMSADDGHTFWLGKLNLPIALARRKVKIQGPMPKLMGMLPAITPAFDLYQAYNSRVGFQSAQ